MGVVGPGTGLGVSALIPDRAQRWLALAGEGGHTSFAPTDDRELILWQAARRRYEHVSMERLLSGSGLQFIYRSLCENRGQTAADYSPADISHRALAGDDTDRSEEHTSELQSLMRNSYAVFCLKKKTTDSYAQTTRTETK